MPMLFNTSDAQLEEVATRLLKQGIPPDQEDYLVLPAEFHHRQEYAAAGQGTLTYWSTSTGAAPIVSNWNSAGVPQTQALILLGLRFAFDPLDAAGGRISAQDAFAVGTSATASVPFTLAEEIKDIFASGYVDFLINNRSYLNKAYSLNRFPAGNGPSFDIGVGAATTTAATNMLPAAAVFNNGAAIKGNEWRFPFPIAVPCMTPVTEVVTWSTVLSVTTKFVLRSEMFGFTVQRANR